MNANQVVMYIIFEHILALLIIAIVVLLRRRWNIPVVILRFTGDKRRPMLLITKARREGIGWKSGLHRLIIKGFTMSMRDFHNNNYYPSVKNSRGALLLWEFKSGWLTPVIPKTMLKHIGEEDKRKLDQALQYFETKSTVKFDFNEDLYKSLMLEAIDDVDTEFFLREQQRQEAQYTGGIKDFLMKHGGAIAIVMVAAIILVGYIVYLDKVPSVAQQCITAGVDAAKSTYLQRFANISGVPLG